MDEFVRRPARRPITNPTRNVHQPPVARANVEIPTIHEEPEEPMQEQPEIKAPEPKKGKKFSFKLPTPKTKKQWIIFGIIAVLLLAGTAYAVYYFVLRDTSEPVAYVAPEPEPEPVTTGQSAVSGREVGLDQVKKPVYAVQIENSPEARPQSGLVDADIVTEAIAEGGITRFNAIFHDKVPANIGPVRSMRPYYIDWFLMYNAGAVHAGGSPEALNDISALGVQDMDHNSSHFRRVSNRYAPHNLYTTGQQMLDLFSSRGYKNGDFASLTRKPIEPANESTNEPTTGQTTEATEPTASKIDLNISRDLYNVSFTWDPATKTYARVMGGAPHVDADSGKQISPEVVVVPVLAKSLHSDRVHTVYGTVGTGELFVFQDGKVIKGTWKKASRSAQWELLDSAGQPIQLSPGQTWFTIIEASSRVSHTP